MNVVSSGRHKRPSKLLDALRQRAQTGGTGHLGFGAVPPQAKRRPAFVAGLPTMDISKIEALGQAGADGIEVTVSREADLADLRSVLAELSVPLGIVLDVAGWAPTNAEELQGVDWVRLSLQASAAPLGWEKPARFITVPENMELRRAPALNMLEIDAVVIDGPWVQTGELSIEDVLRLASLGEICKKPVFLHSGPGFSSDLGSIVSHCGVTGLLYRMESDTSVDMMAAYIKALEANVAEG